MLDGHALAQLRPPRPGRHATPEPLLEQFVLSDVDGASAARRRHRATGAEVTAVAGIRREGYDRPWADRFDLSCGAGDCHFADIDLEVCFREELPIAWDPGLAEDV